MDIHRQIADQVFILRFWQELHSDQGQRWRAQVRDVNTGQLHVFDDVEAALAIVRSLLPSIETNHVDPTTGSSK